MKADDSLLDRITVSADQCGGRPCLRGLRVRVSDILNLLAEGATFEEIIADYPSLVEQDIKAALTYAALESDHRVLIAA